MQDTTTRTATGNEKDIIGVSYDLRAQLGDAYDARARIVMRNHRAAAAREGLDTQDISSDYWNDQEKSRFNHADAAIREINILIAKQLAPQTESV